IDSSNSKYYLNRAEDKKELNDMTGYKQDLTTASKDLIEFIDKIDGKKIFVKNIIDIPDYFDKKNKNSFICPVCKSKRIAKYIYGMQSKYVSDEERKDFEEGNIIYAG